MRSGAAWSFVPRQSARLVVAAIVASVALLLAHGPAAAGVDEDPLFPFVVQKFDCEEDPGTIGQAEEPEGCEGVEGVAITVTDTSGNELGSCITGDGGMCIIDIDVPDDGVVVVTEDESTGTAGYTPRENPVEVEIVNEFSEAKIVNIRDTEELPDTGSGGASGALGLAAQLGIVGALLAFAGLSLRLPARRESRR